jgi:hypothetical protein
MLSSSEEKLFLGEFVDPSLAYGGPNFGKVIKVLEKSVFVPSALNERLGFMRDFGQKLATSVFTHSHMIPDVCQKAFGFINKGIAEFFLKPEVSRFKDLANFEKNKVLLTMLLFNHPQTKLMLENLSPDQIATFCGVKKSELQRAQHLINPEIKNLITSKLSLQNKGFFEEKKVEIEAVNPHHLIRYVGQTHPIDFIVAVASVHYYDSLAANRIVLERNAKLMLDFERCKSPDIEIY